MTAYKRLQLASIFRGAEIDNLELQRRLEEYDRNQDAILNRGIRFEDNVDCVMVEFTSNGTPNTQDTVAHTLGKVPTGFLVVNKDKAGDVYAGGTTWTKTNIYFKTTVASVALKILVF